MSDKKYSAGLMSQSFWFIEMKKIIQLADSGKTEQEIKKLCLEENIFGAAKEYRAKRIYGYLHNRICNLDETLTDIFMRSDLSTQKLINLISIIKGDLLFFEFLYEVYREKIILGIPTINMADANIFFKNKEIQSNAVLNWADGTKKHLKSIYFSFMIDANLLTVVCNEKTITPPILDTELQHYLEKPKNKFILKAITGVV